MNSGKALPRATGKDWEGSLPQCALVFTEPIHTHLFFTLPGQSGEKSHSLLPSRAKHLLPSGHVELVRAVFWPYTALVSSKLVLDGQHQMA